MKDPLQVDDILEIYSQYYRVKPLQVVLGGSRSFNQHDGTMDYDYFGIHEGKYERELYARFKVDGSSTIKSVHIDRIPEIMKSDHYVQAQFIVCNLLWDKIIYIDDKFKPTVEEFRATFYDNLDDYIPLFKTAADLLVDGVVKNGGFDKTEKHWTRWIRVTLTSWYLEDVHILNCDFQFLVEHYGIDLENLISPNDLLKYR